MKPRQPACLQGAKSGGDGCDTPTKDEDAAVSIRRFVRRIFYLFRKEVYLWQDVFLPLSR